MKRKLRSVLALMLALVMALSLAACGKGDDDNDKQPGNTPGNTNNPEFVYNAEFKEISTNTDRGITVQVVTDSGLYVSYSEKVGENIPEGVTPEYEGQYDVYEQRIAFVGLDGNFKPLENYQPLKAAENPENKADFYSYPYIDTLQLRSDGKLVTFEERYTSYSDAPEGMSRESDEYWNYRQYSQEYFIRVLDADGTEISIAPVSVDENSYLNTWRSVLDSDGNLLCNGDAGIIAVAADGSIAYTIDTGDEYIQSMIALRDGKVGVTMWGESGMVMRELDTAAKTLGEKIDLPSEAYDPMPGGGDYDLYYTSGINFFGLDLATGESTKLFNWIDCDIDSNYVQGTRIDEDGNIIALVRHYNYNRYSDEQSSSTELAVVSKVPYDSVPHKTILTMATQYLAWDVQGMVIDFNRNNDTYRIEVHDYSEYNTDDDYEAGVTKLLTEIMAGNLPDLLDLSQLPYDQLAAKGILEDIYPYIDADNEISREDFFPTVLSALEVGGKLYQVCPAFSISSVMGASSVVGDTPGWTYDEFNAALASMPEGCDAFEQYVTRENILRSCLALDMEEYVDWTTGECRFDSEGFIKLLEFASAFPEEYDYENYDYSIDNPMTRIAEGRQMLTMTSIYDFDSMMYNDFYFGGSSTYIGYPTVSGVGNMLSLSSGIGMTKNCADKDAAWQFLRGFLTVEGQNNFDNGLPVNISVFNKRLEIAMTPEYEKDADGNFVLDENGDKIQISQGSIGYGDGTVHEIYAVTQEQADKLMELVNTTTKIADYNSSVFDIVSEEAQAFFAGQKSAEEVARLIQSKANIYVNEQR